MPKPHRVRVNGASYSYVELNVLYFITQYGRKTLDEIADYCGLRKQVVRQHVNSLLFKKMLSFDANTEAYWCSRPDEAQPVLKNAPEGVVGHQSKPQARSANRKVVVQGPRIEIDGTWFSRREVSVLRCLLEAKEALTAPIIAERSDVSLAFTYEVLKWLLRKQLIARRTVKNMDERAVRKRSPIREYVFRYKNRETVRGIVLAAQKAWGDRQ